MSKLLVICLTVFVFPAFVFADVIINEIAWMGTSVSANDEWIELYNNGNSPVDIAGWRIVATDGQPDFTITDSCANTSVAVGGYYLLERTDDDSVPGIAADCIYTGALGNTGEHLQFLNAGGDVIDAVNATDGWPAGDNTTKETMQRSGNTWITVLATPKVANASTGSKTDPDSSSPPNTNNTSQAGGADAAYVQPENLPRIKADAGEDKRAAVGEQIQFRGNAWGLDDVFLENARYAWNFGDGATYEGQNVGHEYMFPGTYTVRLVVSSGKYSAFDDVRVTIGKNMVTISESMPGANGWIEFQNSGDASIHMGGWIIETSATRFIVPLGTTMAPQSFAVLSSATTKLALKNEGDHLYLFYPDGSYAGGIAYVFQAPMGKSVSHGTGGVGVFTEPTPGEPNKIENPTEWHISITNAPSPAISQVSSVKNTTVPPQTADASKEEFPEEQGKEVMERVASQPAAVGNIPVLQKKYRETLWLGGSLILGGLAAVGVVLFRRRKNAISDTVL